MGKGLDKHAEVAALIHKLSSGSKYIDKTRIQMIVNRGYQ